MKGMDSSSFACRMSSQVNFDLGMVDLIFDCHRMIYLNLGSNMDLTWVLVNLEMVKVHLDFRFKGKLSNLNNIYSSPLHLNSSSF